MLYLIKVPSYLRQESGTVAHSFCKDCCLAIISLLPN